MLIDFRFRAKSMEEVTDNTGRTVHTSVAEVKVQNRHKISSFPRSLIDSHNLDSSRTWDLERKS
jgi:hypothetical protein